MSQGSLRIFFDNPLVATITLLAIGLLTWPLWAMLLQGVTRLRGGQARAAE